MRCFFHFLGAHKDAVLAFAAISASFSTALTIIVGLWQTNRQLRITSQIADAQIAATVLSANRQNWINDLRNEISSLIGMLGVVHPTSGKGLNLAFMQTLFAHRAKINLLLNPSEPDHLRLMQLIVEGVRYNTPPTEVGVKPDYTESHAKIPNGKKASEFRYLLSDGENGPEEQDDGGLEI